MKFLYIAILSVIFMSCSQKDVQVPVNDNPGLHEIWDNSRIYILMDVKDGDTIPKLKLGQTITTTQWLVAVDKRLKLKKLINPIEKIIKKRHKKSIHSKEGTYAYFAYLDSVQHKMSFVDFDSIQFMPDYFSPASYFEKYKQDDKAFNKYYLRIDKRHIVLNDSITFDTGISKRALQDSLWNIIGKQTTQIDNKLYLNFSPNLYFDTFLNYYTFFKNNGIPKGKLSQKIFINSNNK